MNFFKSTIGKKQLVGIAGLALSGFVLTHMLGNLLIFVGPKAYNEYGHSITSNPLIYVAEMGLLAFFIGHIILALVLAVKNRLARSDRYYVAGNGPKGTSAVQKTLVAQGILIFVFVVLHLITFKFGTVYQVDYGKGEIRDLYRLMVEVFANPIYVGWYVLCVFLLGLHLSHGLASSFQTLGLHHPKYQPTIKKVSIAYGILVAAGFISQPVFVYLFLQGS